MPRIITGGLGDYLGIDGVMHQTNLGMSDGFGVRAQFEIEPGNGRASVESDG